MTNLEKAPRGLTEKIELEQDSNSVVLVTTTIRKEAFLNAEEILEKKQQEAKREQTKSFLLSIGGGALSGGVIAIVTVLAERGISGSLINVGGFLTVTGGAALIHKGINRGINSQLASRQLKEIQLKQKVK